MQARPTIHRPSNLQYAVHNTAAVQIEDNKEVDQIENILPNNSFQTHILLSANNG